ncbi:3-hydroxyacyl-CoA dehydrogenase/enoyl-CoA hydratase family protein [Legionella jordanis]|uniref:enoyl-CoA hydratase n=1 Tax=Legionella jordanis TaxID=456 RepID=A0A0W0V8B5_9GAMM|nr:3-hydroxyacyl-CoA dehydrogenase/enoyl-CoA hydratase family protein [Legionella jordanis]KTD16118.1 3-hydroxyacyl CoA dehydrogenase oxidoreductase [Legionella jordanis]RMX04654.1 3-hydroxyacyl-CoA dehydrogenase/enoyl-CoA hydratase family protein [Legionella jordanis]RMX18364.1 3-hydroxyacyl-CoA dehydrogenase/enoyl-CoA hydratase family protein [Legionella jordanis]VEH12422.1 3-hydroxyacyl CoA dehydrogenase oxidoreductase [Legionella jordanis]HAT8713934.1 3-hydroxyacyl-CoA dehydrogenase [Legio
MQEPFFIKKVAVLGAGVMGAQIAAHCVNAGIETLLFDLAAKEGGSNALVEKAISNLSKLKPSPLATPHTASFLKAQNYEENLQALADCDLIIEAIAERLDWKEDLYQKIAPYLNKKTILVSNTSGLSINTLSGVLPEAQRSRFCGVHFFNPPRYMHLAELIPADTTEPALLDELETWLTRRLGKGVIRAKDTPNFIANRIGVFSLLATLHHAEAMNLGLDEVDALTGPLLGRPKSATFRTMDVVGLDTMLHVVHTMQEQLGDDPWHPHFKLPEWLQSLIKEGHLGQKTGQGIYRKNGKIIEVYDLNSKTYRPAKGEVSEEVKTIMKTADLSQRMQQLAASADKQARFLMACYRDLFHYSAYHLQEIAHSVRDVDLAIRWGFGWQQGPFETWEGAGVSVMLATIEKARTNHETLSQAQLPQWLSHVTSFYKDEGAYSPEQNDYVARSKLPVYDRQIFPDRVAKEKMPYMPSLFENDGVNLWLLNDDVAVVSFKSKANTIGQAVLDGLEQAIDKAEQDCKGLIIYQHDANNFSSGADLRGVASLIQQNKLDALDAMIRQFQAVAMRLKYSSIPTVAALRGRALGGGCELMMHCDAVVAAFESYPGLVEAGVGLIPAGGGCKEMSLRAAQQAKDADLLLFIQPYFQQIATAQVAGSAAEARQKGFLRECDRWVMNSNEVLFVALKQVQMMQALNYQAPLKGRFKVAGREGHARLQAGLVNWLEGGFISQHDYILANHLAEVLCGGNVNQGEMVDEEWMLHREREAFMALAANPLSQARIAHLLETGKPLRN